MRAEREAIGVDAALASALEACERLVALHEFSAAARIGLYAAVAGEIPTRPLYEAARAAGKACLLPAVVAEGKPLRFLPLERWEDLRPGRYGVPEPPGDGAESALSPSDLVVVPGLAFDVEGRRLGSGAGYYDRSFPPGAPAPLLVGFAFDRQRVERVPSVPHDRAMDILVTERGVWRVGSKQG